MANKKIRVGIADESLTPEEEHQIEVKVDQMMALDASEKSEKIDEPKADEPALIENAPTPKPKKPARKPAKGKKITIAQHDEPTSETSPEPDEVAQTGTPSEPDEPTDDGVPPPETVLNLDEAPKSNAPASKIQIKTEEGPAETIAVKPAGPPPLPGEAAEAAAPVAEPAEPKAPKSIEVKHVSSGIDESERPEAAEAPAEEPQPVPVRHKEIVIQPPKEAPKKVAAPKPAEAVSLDEPLQPAPGTKRKHVAPKDTDYELLAQNEAIAKAFESKGPSPFGKVLKLLSGLWRAKKARWLVVAAVIVIVLAVIGAVPVTRSLAGNLVGLRGTATIQVLDATDKKPLQGARLELGGATATTDDNGTAVLHHVKLGSQQLTVQKIAYDATRLPLFVGLTGAAKTTVALTTNGVRYNFHVTAYLSGQPIVGAHVTSGQASAASDKDGDVTLAIPKPLGASTFAISASGYRTATASTSDNTAAVSVTLVPDRPDIYISNQNATFDVYRSDIDGQHHQLVLPGTGNENSQLTVIPDAAGDEAALVSTRDNVRDKDGYLLQTLTLVAVSNGKTITVDHSERIQLIDWFGSRIVYVEAKAGASAANPSRYQLFSYDYKTKKALELDHANYFNDVVSAGGAIYYATSNTYSGGISQFMKINADGSGRQLLLTNEVWNIFRTDHNGFMLDTPTSWYSYKLGDAKPTAAASGYSGTSRLYVDAADGKHSAWVDTRDGKGALILYDAATQKETVLATQDGLSYPVRWLNDSVIIYRVKSPQETADYAVSIQGGSPKKVTDVTDAAGMTLWYYY